MSTSKPPVWKKPKTKVYDYNYNLGEHYYKPQLQHMDNKYANRSAIASSPPRAKTFAERFAENPVYGNNSPLEYRTSGIPDSPFTTRRASLQEELGAGSSGLGSRRQPLFESGRGLTPDLTDEIRPRIISRPRLDLGERLLEAAGGSYGSRSGLAVDTSFGRGISPAVQDEPLSFDDVFFNRRKLASVTADADFSSEDPFRRRFDALASASNEENLLSDFKKDSQSAVAGFRSRMQARRQRDEEANSSELESSGFQSRVDQIRSRAKARMADLEDDLPNLSLRSTSGSDSVSRARAVLRDLEDLDSSNYASSAASSKTVRITKRTIKTTIDSD